MISTVFLKSTVRPWPSVRRPSSITCSSTLKTSVWAFSISSSRTTRVRAPAHRLGELAALLVADVAGRRADEPRDGVLLHVLGHVDPDHRVLRVEHELGQRARQLGLADAGRAEEQERADRAVGVAAGPARERRSASETASTASSWPITRWCRRSSMWISFSTSPSTQPRDRDAGPLADDLGDLVDVDVLGQVDRRLVAPRGALLGARRAAASSSGISPWRSSAARW